MRDDEIRIRLLADRDWDTVVALEAAAYAEDGLSEGREALESRGRASPQTCFVLEHEEQVVGYLLTLPYPLFESPDLSRAEESGFHSRNLHAHDLVIAKEYRGRGLAPRLMHHMLLTAREQRFERISMVAVRGADVLWAPLGYRRHPEVALPESYGTQAIYMSMAVQAIQAT